jgi:hypothetical protein
VTTAGATRADYGTTAHCRHPVTETVTTGPDEIAGLKSALHRSCLRIRNKKKAARRTDDRQWRCA